MISYVQQHVLSAQQLFCPGSLFTFECDMRNRGLLSGNCWIEGGSEYALFTIYSLGPSVNLALLLVLL